MSETRAQFRVEPTGFSLVSIAVAAPCERHEAAHDVVVFLVSHAVALELSRRLVDVAGPDPVVEQRVAIEVTEALATADHARRKLEPLNIAVDLLTHEPRSLWTRAGLDAALQVVTELRDRQAAALDGGAS